MDVVTRLCDEVIVLESGKIIARGSAEDVKYNPLVIEAYLGKKEESDSLLPKPISAHRKFPEVALEVKKITAGYGMGDILVDLNIEVRKGQVVVVIGANGVGKTTSMRVISGQLKPSAGNVLLWGEDITMLPAYGVVSHGLSHTPEGRGVFGELSVEDNLLLGGFTRLPRFFGYHREAATDLRAMYELFPILLKYRNRAAGTLSGGEQQMLAIARSLMSKPQILLLDEPSMGLAPAVVKDVFKAIKELNDKGISILLVEQIATMAMSVADYAYVLDQGHVVVEGIPEELRQNPKILAAYLGD
jgi:ABC-type branched-subunit amino acid transport system ATPase component